MGAQEAASRLWAFYQSVKGNAHENFFIGPLWGLVDLEDPRAADALDELLWAERVFYEAFAMAYKAGDARALVPLMYLFLDGGESLKDSAAWALVGVAHRVGRDALLAALKPSRTDTGVSLAQRHSLVDLLLRLPQRGADAYFTVFYQGLTPDMIDLEDMVTELNVMDRLRLLIEEGDLSDQEPPPPGQRPGRNDPCWCGSGAKYKHCHWRKAREQGRSAHAANVP